VLDVGANIGLMAVPILASNSQCRVISPSSHRRTRPTGWNEQ
jgi:hypothetical protein